MVSKITLANSKGEDVTLHDVSTGTRGATSIEGLMGVGSLRQSKRVRPSAHGSLNETQWEEGRSVQLVLEVSGATLEAAAEEFRRVSQVLLETLDNGPALLKWTEGVSGNKLQMLVKLDSAVEPIFLGGVGTLISFPVSLFAADPRAYTQTSKTETGASITGTEAEQEWLSTGTTGSLPLAIDATHIYFAHNGPAIGRATIAGGSVEPEWVKTAKMPTDIVVNGSNVFWTTEAGIGRCTLAGGTIENEWLKTANTSTKAQPEALAIDGTHLYWWNTGTSGSRLPSIGRSTVAGGTIEKEWIVKNSFFALTASQPPAIAVDSSFIYFVQPSSIGRATIAGATVEQEWVKGASQPAGIDVSATFVYWTNRTGNTVGRAKIAGTEVNQAFVSGALTPGALAVNASNLFWDNAPFPLAGAVARAPIAGGPSGSTVTIAQAGNRPTPLAFKVNGPCANPAVVRESDGSRIALTGTIGAGNYVEINVADRTVKLNGVSNVLSMLNAANTNWQAFSPLASTKYLLTATSATAATLEATYRSAFA